MQSPVRSRTHICVLLRHLVPLLSCYRLGAIALVAPDIIVINLHVVARVQLGGTRPSRGLV